MTTIGRIPPRTTLPRLKATALRMGDTPEPHAAQLRETLNTQYGFNIEEIEAMFGKGRVTGYGILGGLRVGGVSFWVEQNAVNGDALQRRGADADAYVVIHAMTPDKDHDIQTQLAAKYPTLKYPYSETERKSSYSITALGNNHAFFFQKQPVLLFFG